MAGATGNVGRELVALLRADGLRVRTMSRQPALDANLTVDHVQADLLDPSSLESALDGVRRVFVAAPIPVLAAATKNVCRMAAKTDVDHLVLLSSSIVELDSDNPYGAAHRRAESAVRDVGIAATILRPGAFCSNALSWAPAIRSGTPLTTLAGDRALAPVDPRDIATIASVVLQTDRHHGRAISIAGATLITPAEQVATLSRLLGRRLHYESTDRATAIERLTPEHGPAAVALVDALRHPGVPWATASSVVETVTGRRAASFQDWAVRNLHQFDVRAL